MHGLLIGSPPPTPYPPPPSPCPLQNDMESLEQMQGMPPGMYHRYGVLDEDMDEDDEERAENAGGFSNGAGTSGTGVYTADMLVAGMAGLGVQDNEDVAEGDEAAAGKQEGEAAADSSSSSRPAGQGNWSLMAHPGELESCTAACRKPCWQHWAPQVDDRDVW